MPQETKFSTSVDTLAPCKSISSNDCAVHGITQTPHLDKLLQNRPKAKIQELADIAQTLNDGEQCAKCAVQAAVAIITGFVQEMYTAKRSGKLSKEDKKALKLEVKGLMKGIKGDIKSQRKQLKGRL
ncbi:hypothetical protein ACHAP5_002085 [Fusarium lateritium]